MRRRKRRPAVAGIAAVALVGGSVAGWSALHKDKAPPIAEGCFVAAGGLRYGLDFEQAANAVTIAAVARAKDLPNHAVTVAVATALQESNLYNLDYGDRDSLGLFQQRPSQGWGTAAQVRDPVYAAGAFYRELVKIKGWEDLDVTVAAQRVQRSAAPSAYAKWEDESRAVASAFTGEVAGTFVCQYPLPKRRSGSTGEAGRKARLADLAGRMQSELGLRPGTPLDAASGRLAAAWAVAHGLEYGVETVTFDGLRWTPFPARWAPVAPASNQVAVVLR